MPADNFTINVLTIGAGETSLPAGVGVAGDSVAFKALTANAGPVYVGNAGFTGSADGWPLAAGEGFSVDYLNASEFKFRGTSGDKVAYLITRA
jgi:hypothetical protein